ncbi:lipid II:glycine glycyltransferase FemX [Agrococcus sp. SGAir0287]|uniref:lipid II:glycine glycyltransferase FemX n=1 Tax=Agrococcus sp. SGAir0287 TaxID=2070347 RepID=UPI0010F6070C|nr:GNAT family N-acetyltransferase [Agrococcus sp. SGAir0287]
MTGETVHELREATAAEIADWDALVAQNPDGGQFTQTLAFAEVKRWDGFRTHHMVYDGDEPVRALVLERHGVVGRFWYVPSGPWHPRLDSIVAATRAYVERHRRDLVSVKLEPRLRRTDEHMALLRDAGLVEADDVQIHTHTVIADLAQGPDALFASFSKAARKNIRHAEREGYTVERVEPTPALMDQMWARMQTISGGRGLAGMRGEEYYRTVWKAFTDHGMADWWVGEDGGDGPQTITFTIPFGRDVIDKDEGSRPDRRINGGAHLGRWTRMRHYAERGFEGFDMMGAPPSWRKDDETHFMHSLARFKTQFAPIADFVPSFDLELKPGRQRLWDRYVRPIEWRAKRRYTGLW